MKAIIRCKAYRTYSGLSLALHPFRGLQWIADSSYVKKLSGNSTFNLDICMLILTSQSDKASMLNRTTDLIAKNNFRYRESFHYHNKRFIEDC